MDIYKFIVILLCTGCVFASTFQLPRLVEPSDSVHLMTNEAIRTLPGHRPSYKYEFLDLHLWKPKGQNVRIFGVKTGGNAILTLHDSTGTLFDLSFVLNTGKGAECWARYMRKKPIETSFPCVLNLDAGRMLWFTLETSVDRAAIYPPGKLEPCVEISSHDVRDHSVDFNSYDRFSVSTQQVGLWDFQGHMLDRKDLKGQRILRPRLWKALQKMTFTYMNMKQYFWRCDYAKAELDKTPNTVVDRSKYVVFHHKYCKEQFMYPYAQAIARHEALFLVNGVSLGKPDTYHAARFFRRYRH